MNVSTAKVVAAGSTTQSQVVETGDFSQTLTLEKDLTPLNPTDLQSSPHFPLWGKISLDVSVCTDTSTTTKKHSCAILFYVYL